MSESILINLARKSIEEVLQAERLIDVTSHIEDHPELAKKYATFVNLYQDSVLQASYGSLHPHKSLIEDIIYNAKFAAFEDATMAPLTTSKYLHCEIEVSILSELQELSFETLEDLLSQIEMGVHGLTIVVNNRAATLMPYYWKEHSSKEDFLNKLLSEFNWKAETISPELKVYIYSVQSARDKAILKP